MIVSSDWAAQSRSADQNHLFDKAYGNLILAKYFQNLSYMLQHCCQNSTFKTLISNLGSGPPSGHMTKLILTIRSISYSYHNFDLYTGGKKQIHSIQSQRWLIAIFSIEYFLFCMAHTVWNHNFYMTIIFKMIPSLSLIEKCNLFKQPSCCLVTCLTTIWSFKPVVYAKESFSFYFLYDLSEIILARMIDQLGFYNKYFFWMK